MESKNDKTGSDVSGRYGIVLGVLGLLGSAIGLFIGDWKDIPLLFTIVSLSCIFYYGPLFRRRNKPDPPESLVKIDEENELIRRPVLEKEFEDAIKSKNKITIVTGKSGVGKSTTAQRVLEEQAPTYGYSFEDPIREYDPAKLKEKLERHDVKKFKRSSREITQGKIYLFDQFERLFQQQNIDDVKKSIELVEAFIADIEKPSSLSRLFVVTREEWFASLFGFRDIIRWSQHVIAVHGYERDDGNTWEQLREKIKYLASAPPEVQDAIGNDLATDDNSIIVIDKDNNNKKEKRRIIRPVELSMVLKAIQGYNKNRNNPIEKKRYEAYGKVRGITEKYLRKFIEASEEPVNTARVLFALSVSPHGKRPLTLEQIAQLTHLQIEQVEKAIFFLKDKLIREMRTSPEKYDWMHDFLAEKFQAMSGTILEPADRDNIAFFWYSLQKKETDIPQVFDCADQPQYNLRRNHGLLFLILSISVLVMRFFGPWFGWETWLEPFNFTVPGFERIDIPFFFVFVSLGLWATYMFWIHNRLLTSLPEDRLGTACCWLLSPISFVCLVLTTIYPIHWLTFTGIGGVPVGIKFLQLSRTKGTIVEGLPFHKCGGMFLKFGFETCFNCIVVIVIGVFYTKIFGANDSILKDASLLHVGAISLTIWVVMVWFAVMISMKQHVSKEVIATLRGEYFRNRYRY